MNDGEERMRRGARTIVIGIWAFVLLLLLAFIAGGWPNYWTYIAAETTPLAWLESVLLVLTAFVAGLNAFVGYAAGCFPRKMISGWAVVAAGFAWLALDERFAAHERLRDKLLKPTGFKLLPWMEAGDLLVPVYAVVGLAVAWGIWLLLAKNKPARLFFVSALILSAVAVGMDTVDVRSLGKGTERFMQSLEEAFETFAMTCFLSSFVLAWTRLLGWLRRPSLDAGEARREPDML